jgi:hypothetical protein
MHCTSILTTYVCQTLSSVWVNTPLLSCMFCGDVFEFLCLIVRLTFHFSQFCLHCLNQLNKLPQSTHFLHRRNGGVSALIYVDSLVCRRLSHLAKLTWERVAKTRRPLHAEPTVCVPILSAVKCLLNSILCSIWCLVTLLKYNFVLTFDVACANDTWCHFKWRTWMDCLNCSLCAVCSILFNLLNTKRNLLCTRNQSVPRCKHFPNACRKPPDLHPHPQAQ